MNKLILLLVALLLTLPAASAQPQESLFDHARPGYRFSFPKDHGSHPAFRTEWWYFTGNLEAGGRRDYGYELTFFRQGNDHPEVLKNPSRWAPRHLYFAHFAVTDISKNRFYYRDRMSREAIGKAGAATDRLEVWIDQWRAVQEGETIRLQAEEKASGKGAQAGWKIDLALSPAKPPVIHGEGGISKKGGEEGQASHYYSFTRLQTSGSVWIDGKEEKVTGWSWMDHEFSSSILNAHQTGWDWFSIQLEDGSDVMFFQIRRDDGRIDPASSGTVIGADGRERHLSADDFTLTPIEYWKSPANPANYPVGWRIEIPSERLLLESKPAVAQQELITSQSTRIAYWEGASDFQGTKNGKPVSGKGYVELTGYAAPFNR